jgi:hypothetical protein
MHKLRKLAALLALIALLGVACGGDDEPAAQSSPGAESGDASPAPSGDPVAQMNSIISCLEDAGFVGVFPTNNLFSEERRITMDPPYTLIYIYGDESKIESDTPKIEENSGSGSSIATEGNVLVSYQENPKDDAAAIEDCAFGA